MTDPQFGTVIILSENPMHDTGGGQRSTQLALEFLFRGYRVLFLARGDVTETVDLGISFEQEELYQLPLSAVEDDPSRLVPFLGPETLVISQVPVRAAISLHRRARSQGAVTAYDLIDLWDSELGAGWYTGRAERRIARASDLLLASAQSLGVHLKGITGREAHPVPNAFNSRIFDQHKEYARPADLPSGRIAIYVGALWGGWFDWSLVRTVAGSLPETRFVFIGDYRGEGGHLPDNCEFLGLKAQHDLPAYLSHSEVGFLPWRTNALTHATSPLKIYEFIAMGLPVVTPDTEPLIGLPGVSRSADPDHFASLVATIGREALDAEASADMRAFSEDNSWEHRADSILQLASTAASGKTKMGLRGLWARRTDRQ
jgi:glycosyltransferase involved in cell wall biosynthesis